MEDDLFGASVWGTSSSPAVLTSPLKESNNFASFPAPEIPQPDGESTDDFDEFETPAQTVSELDVQEDDDFGDFGDFEDVQAAENVEGFDAGDAFVEQPQEFPPVSSDEWQPLQLDPLPSREELERQVDYILRPLWANDDFRGVLSDEDVRQAEGISQILVTPESREFYQQLFSAPPPSKVPNWTRSEIRRRHLISLGIPVNLDEILPKANGRALPPLHITTRPMSAPPGPRGDPSSNAPSPSRSRVPTPRSGTPQPGVRSTAAQLGLGPKPELDQTKIDSVLALDSDSMALMPLAKLEGHLKEIRAQTANTSATLTYLLQTRDALQQDSETYNSLIAELISEAQKSKNMKGKTPARRSSGMR